MSIFKTDDPLADFNRHEAEQESRLARRPVCCYCEEHIQHDHLFLINDEMICPDCLESYFRKDVDDFCE